MVAIHGRGVEEEAEQDGEGGGFGRGGHQADDRGGSALVDVGCPDVEGGGGDLEAETDEDHADSEPAEERGFGDSHARGDGGDAGGAGCAEAQRDAVEEEGGGEAAEKEVLDGGLGCGGAAFAETGEDVGGDRGDFEADEDHEELDGRSHEHHAGGAEADEGKVLAGMRYRAVFEVIERGEQGNDDDCGDEEVEEDGEVVDLDGRVEGGEGAAHLVVDEDVLVPGGGGGGGGAEDGEPAEGLAGLAGGEHGLGEHDEYARDGEDEFGEEAEEVGGH